MNTSRFIVSIIIVIASHSLSAMEALSVADQPVENRGTARFISNLGNIPYAMRDLYNNPDLNAYQAQSFVLTQKGVIDAMNKAVEERNATINLSTGVHHLNQRDLYKATNVECVPSQHGKNIVGFDCSPSKKSPKKALFLTGSANATDATWPTGNPEANVLIEGDIPLAKKAYRLMKSPEVLEKKKIVIETPTKRKVYSSGRTALNQSRAYRILSVAQQLGEGRIVWVSSMNFNDKNMAYALSKAAQSGADTRLIVNKTALTKNGIPLLQQMFENGVQVYVFYPSEGARIIQHKKELIRNDLYVVSNANFTDEGDTQSNLETYFPGDEPLILAAKIDFERVQDKCVTWEKALELYQQDKERRTKQKELKKRKKTEQEEDSYKKQTKKLKITQ